MVQAKAHGPRRSFRPGGVAALLGWLELSWWFDARRCAVGFLLALALLVGCTPQKDPCSPADLSNCAVDDIEIEGNQAVSDDDIEEKIATAETGGVFEGVPFFGGLDAVTVEYERFDRFVLDRDLQRIERLYRAKGYYEARVTAGRVTQTNARSKRDPSREGMSEEERREDDAKRARVAVEIHVEEGKPVIAGGAQIEWKDWRADVDPDVTKRVADARNQLIPPFIFTEERYEKTRTAMLKALHDGGYAYASVVPKADISLINHIATTVFTIEIGPPCTFGKIDLVGLGEIPEWQIRPALGFEEGEKFSTEALEAAEVALAEFNVFGSISIEPRIPTDGKRPTKVPVVVTVERSALRSVKLGGGFEAGDVVATRGVTGWQNRNSFGFLDRFNIELRPRLILYPSTLSTLFDQEPFRIVPEIGLFTEYGFPIPYEPRTKVFINGEARIGRPLNTKTPAEPKPEDNVPGNRELFGRFGVERRFWFSHFYLSPSFNIRLINPFSYNQDEPPDAYQTLSIRFLEMLFDIDFRESPKKKWDPINPQSGFLITTQTQLGGYFLGGDANDVRFKPGARLYVKLTRRILLAARVGAGFLFTSEYGDGSGKVEDYGKILDEPIATSGILAPDGDVTARNALEHNIQVLEQRALFSGGPTTNRGYGYNEIGPHRVLDADGVLLGSPLPIGGRFLWDMSVELRFPITTSVGATVFIDASDVVARLDLARIDHPHISTGVGIRYETPVGPLRFDLGFRIPGLQTLGETDLGSCIKKGTTCDTVVIDEGDPSELFGAPLAPNLAIGNAF